MKESPKRYINPFLSDEENDKVNLWNNVEDEKFEKSLTPSTVPSESLEKAKEFNVDKNVSERELPELIACNEDNGFHAVTDICVDDGLSHGEKIECEKEHQKLSCIPITVNGDKHDNMIKDNICSQLISSPLKDFSASDELKLLVESDIIQNSENSDSDNSMQNGERKLDSNSNSLNNSSNNDIDQISNDDTNEAQSAGSKADISNETKMEENTISNSDVVASDNATLANQLQRSGYESSFTITASVSGLITYSGPISSAGSISHRSDGSNTSVRSFAFPILQNEWNSSPVRMRKVDSRQKNGGWKQAFMCFRF